MHRAFGQEITNLADQHPRAKRNHSFLHHEKPKHSKQALSGRNRSLIMPAAKPHEQKTLVIDTQMVPEYFEESMRHLRAQQSKAAVLGNYIFEHKTVSQSSRAKLIDWLSELHYKYKMFPQTIFTAVSYLDRYLSRKAVALGELQLVGSAALLIAAKFEQTYQVPQLRQLISASAGQYTATQLLNMEADLLHAFGFQLIANTSFKFFQPLAKLAELDPKNMHLGQYVLELALTKAKFLEYRASQLASATIYLIKKIRRSQSAWGENVAKLINYGEGELKGCAKQLCTLLEEAPALQNCKAMKKKFGLPAFHEVTKIKLERKK